MHMKTTAALFRVAEGTCVTVILFTGLENPPVVCVFAVKNEKATAQLGDHHNWVSSQTHVKSICSGHISFIHSNWIQLPCLPLFSVPAIQTATPKQRIYVQNINSAHVFQVLNAPFHGRLIAFYTVNPLPFRYLSKHSQVFRQRGL